MPETLTLPCGFYDEATRRLQDHTRDLQQQGVAIEQHVQTNATLINDQWAECFKRNRIVVGECGGPRLSTMFIVVSVVAVGRMPTPCGIRTPSPWIPFHAIAVLTEEALGQPEVMYAFLRDEGIHQIGFNVEEQEGVNARSSMQGLQREMQYRAFLRRFWECNQRDGFPIQLREFSQVLEMIDCGQRLRQNEMNRPYSILSVDAAGNFSTLTQSCCRWKPNGMGCSTWATCAISPWRRRPEPMLSAGCTRYGVGHGAVRPCDYYGFCGGGTGSNKYWEHGL